MGAGSILALLVLAIVLIVLIVQGWRRGAMSAVLHGFWSAILLALILGGVTLWLLRKARPDLF